MPMVWVGYRMRLRHRLRDGLRHWRGGGQGEQQHGAHRLGTKWRFNAPLLPSQAPVLEPLPAERPPKSSKRELKGEAEELRAPAKESALYSPSDRPMATVAPSICSSPPSARSFSTAAREATKMAGCDTAVRSSSSLGPSTQRSSRS